MRMLAPVFWMLCVGQTAFAERLPIQAYTAEDGLPDNHINRIRQDSRGFLWLATDAGLSRFDGQSFVNYSTAHGLPHPWVNDLIESRNGHYWVATDAGVCKFDPSLPPSSKSAFLCYWPASTRMRAA
jgi:ligand-binding sensor domain-containing protein